MSKTGFTWSPDKNPFTGLKLSKIASYLALSSGYNIKNLKDNFNNGKNDLTEISKSNPQRLENMQTNIQNTFHFKQNKSK